jgi:hypothetical protein
MSQGQHELPISALTALGDEFERLAASPRPARSRLPLVAPWKLVTPTVAAILAVFVIATSPGQALARHIGELLGLAAEQEVLQPICGDAAPCVVVNGATGDRPILVTPGSNLLENARPASECPAATAAYLAIGIHVDAFLGPCPDPADLPRPPAESGAAPRTGGSGSSDETRRERFQRSIGAPTDPP